MNELFFKKEWTFKETILNIEALKSRIWDIFASFSCDELKQEIMFKKILRDEIYSLNFERWRCDRILEFIYNDIEFEVLQKLI